MNQSMMKQIIQDIKKHYFIFAITLYFVSRIISIPFNEFDKHLSHKNVMYHTSQTALDTIIEIPVPIKSQTFEVVTKYEFTKYCESDITLPPCASIVNSTSDDGYCHSYNCCKYYGRNGNIQCINNVDFAVTKYKIIHLYDIILTLEWNNNLVNYTLKSVDTPVYDGHFYVLYMMNMTHDLIYSCKYKYKTCNQKYFNNVIDDLYDQNEYEKLIIFNKNTYISFCDNFIFFIISYSFYIVVMAWSFVMFVSILGIMADDVLRGPFVCIISFFCGIYFLLIIL